MFYPRRVVSLLVTIGILGVAGWGISHAAGIGGPGDPERQFQLSGGSKGSYFRRANLAVALSLIRAKTGPDAKLLELDVFPGSVKADVSTGSATSGRVYQVGLDRHLHAGQLVLTGPGSVAASIFPASAISPSTPEQLIAQLARTHQASAGSIRDIIATVDAATGKPEWNVYRTDDRTHYGAALDGTGLTDPLRRRLVERML